ncbi:hypothetical protein [Aureimonas psammosilenae]|uniref:hypothetical protein n=1 Tax=Aureimonas psammosilenae TaxID=2495496 RepID=UPI001260CBCC|nr:hypothetical protein [Aureimonas psammosilenae]
MAKAVLALAAVLSASFASATWAAGEAKPSGGEMGVKTQSALGECALRYGQSLKRIGDENLPNLTALTRRPAVAGDQPAGTPATAGDPTLPGTLLFVSRPRPRSPAEIGALTAAVALARSKGATSAVVSDDNAWIAARLREDLSDYLRQKPTPFICNGVKDYLRTLRSYAVRLGPVAGQREARLATQKAATERAVRAALEAIRLTHPASVASVKPTPSTMAEVTNTAPTPVASDASPAKPEEAASETALRLDRPEDLIATVDRLVSDVTAAELVIESAPAPAPAPNGAPVPPPLDLSAHPVLAKLAAAKPLVTSAKPTIRDQPVRLKVLAAFADLEMLDYLLEAKAEVENPVAGALAKAMDEIEKAQSEDCTCLR